MFINVTIRRSGIWADEKYQGDRVTLSLAVSTGTASRRITWPDRVSGAILTNFNTELHKPIHGNNRFATLSNKGVEGGRLVLGSSGTKDTDNMLGICDGRD